MSAQTAADLVEKSAIIRKVPGKEKWKVMSGKGKSLGEYDSKAKAEKRLQQVEMFKHMKGKKRKSNVSIAMRVACRPLCPVCGMPVWHNYATDSYACQCGYVGPNAPAAPAAPATVIAGADIYERFDELMQAVGRAESDESEEAEHLRELDELLYKRDEVFDAIKENDKEKKDTSVAAAKKRLDGALKKAAASNPRLASIIGTVETSMAPDKIARNLRTIASRIDGSKKPSRELVAADIWRVIAAIEHDAAVPGMEWLDDAALLKLSEELVAALKSKSAGELEKVIPSMIEQLKNYEFRAKAERQKQQLKPGPAAV